MFFKGLFDDCRKKTLQGNPHVSRQLFKHITIRFILILSGRGEGRGGGEGDTSAVCFLVRAKITTRCSAKINEKSTKINQCLGAFQNIIFQISNQNFRRIQPICFYSRYVIFIGRKCPKLRKRLLKKRATTGKKCNIPGDREGMF